MSSLGFKIGEYTFLQALGINYSSGVLKDKNGDSFEYNGSSSSKDGSISFSLDNGKGSRIIVTRQNAKTSELTLEVGNTVYHEEEVEYIDGYPEKKISFIKQDRKFSITAHPCKSEFSSLDFLDIYFAYSPGHATISCSVSDGVVSYKPNSDTGKQYNTLDETAFENAYTDTIERDLSDPTDSEAKEFAMRELPYMLETFRKTLNLPKEYGEEYASILEQNKAKIDDDFATEMERLIQLQQELVEKRRKSMETIDFQEEKLSQFRAGYNSQNTEDRNHTI